MRAVSYHVLLIAVVAAMVGCAAPRAPRPPSLQLPRPPSDLAAARKGDKVYLTWTAPQKTTDGENIRHPGPTLICRDARPAERCAQVVSELPPAAPILGKTMPPPQKVEFTDTLPAGISGGNPAATARYAVEVQNARGRSAGFSNQVEIPLAQVYPPRPGMRVEVTAEGIVISWPGWEHPRGEAGLELYQRVYRRVEGSTANTLVTELPDTVNSEPRFVDHGFEWEKRYAYWVTSVTAVIKDGKKVAEVEGDDSPTIEVFAHDVFPPAVPGEVQAVASGVGQPPFVDLTWAPDTDVDLAGYNVYRWEQDAPLAKINREVVATPSFRDNDVRPGHSYSYAVSAVDVRGNESARSAEATESVP